MANLVTTQILVDGYRNVVVRVDGFLDTSDLAATVIVDPATLSEISNGGNLGTRLRVDKVTSSIEVPLGIYMAWDATTPVRFLSLNNATEEFDAKCFGGYQNNAGVGNTGKITITSQGWTAGAILSFSMLIEMVKQ